MSTSRRNADDIARDYTQEALDTIHEIMIEPLAEHRDRLRAAETLLDRGHGKAVSAVINVPAAKKLQAQLVGMTEDQLYDVIRSQPLPRMLQHVQDVEFTPVETADPLLALDDDTDPLLR